MFQILLCCFVFVCLYVCMRVWVFISFVVTASHELQWNLTGDSPHQSHDAVYSPVSMYVISFSLLYRSAWPLERDRGIL